MEDTAYTWSPPQYDTSRPPSLKATLQPSQAEDFPENFARAAKWCPDGATFLTHCEDRSFQLFTTIPSDDSVPLAPKLTIFHQPSPILDFVWYPTASPLNPSTFCFIASVRDCPVKLLDASDGRLRASYRIVDHRERQVAPHSLTFDLSAERLYCGFEDAIEVFDISRPGHGIRLPTTPSKKSRDGLKGIISALAFVPFQSSDIYAAGSLCPTSSNIALFSSTQGLEPIMFLSGGPNAGVTQIQFNPLMPHLMYTAHRRHATIYAWDLRSHLDGPLMTYKLPMHAHLCGGEYGYGRERTKERTNQKLKFDVDLGGKWLGSGDHCGRISLFDLHNPETPEGQTSEVHPTLEFSAHGDAIGSVSFHPLHSTLLSVSGSRHFEPASDSEDSEEGSDVDENGEGLDTGAQSSRVIRRKRPKALDRSIKTWSFGFDNPEAQMPPQDRPTTGLDEVH